MKVTQLRLTGQGTWLPLELDSLHPELNVLFGPARCGKSTVARLAAQLLYGKVDGAWRTPAAVATPLAEGSLEVDSTQGKFVLRRHRDGTPQGRLSIASAGGTAVESHTIRSLLGNASPRLLAELYAVEFANQPRPAALLEGEFAREFTRSLTSETPIEHAEHSGIVCQQHATVVAPQIDRRHIDELVRRRDEIVRHIEEQMSGRRRESAALEQELREVEAKLADRREKAEALAGKLRSVEGAIAEIAARLRYFSLEAAVRQAPAIDAEQHRAQLEQLDAEIARCRQTLSDLQAREASLRRELAEVHADGTADSASCLADQRATVGVLERLLNDLDAEVSQLARAHEPGRCVGCESHARISPVAQMLRQQLYALCGQVTEQERTVRRVQLHAESRQLARAQTDLSERLEHLLERRQSLVHQTQLSVRPVVVLPSNPAANHCQCEHHHEFVRHADAMILSGANRGQYEDETRRRRLDLERQQQELREASDAMQQEIAALDSRWQRLQQDRAQAAGRVSLDERRAELERLETEITRALNERVAPIASEVAATGHRQIWKASDVLAQLTGGQLTQIRMSREGRAASIVDRTGRALSLTELSAAQQDQLYVALTLALVSSFAQRGIDLPLLLDEPFLRQDAAGAATMAGVLEEFTGQGRQAIVLTENREALRRFESLGVAVRDIDLARRQPVAQTPAPPAPLVTTVAATPEPVAGATVRLVRETVGDAAPQLRLAGQWSQTDQAQEVFYLTPEAPLANFPVLGNETAKVFSGLELQTVADLLAADAADVAARLKRRGITAETVRLWQTHMSLMCFVPSLSLNDAQILAANEVTSPDALYTIDLRLLHESIGRFLGSERGRRFAAAGRRVTRERLVELQKLARRQRDRWQQASEQYGWNDRPTVPLAKPAAQPAAQRRAKSAPLSKPVLRTKPQTLRFLLDRKSPIVDAPSIGRTASERLTNVGIRTVADLLNANPDSTAAEIGESRVTAEVITRWQCEARLACRIPELRSLGARLLAAAGFTEAEQVAGMGVDELYGKVRAVCRSEAGKRIVGGGKAPTRERIEAWIRQATHRRPLEAA